MSLQWSYLAEYQSVWLLCVLFIVSATLHVWDPTLLRACFTGRSGPFRRATKKTYQEVPVVHLVVGPGLPSRSVAGGRTALWQADGFVSASASPLHRFKHVLSYEDMRSFDSTKDAQLAASELAQRLQEVPHVVSIIAGSRGATIVAELVARGHWSGPVVLLSPILLGSPSVAEDDYSALVKLLLANEIPAYFARGDSVDEREVIGESLDSLMIEYGIPGTIVEDADHSWPQSTDASTARIFKDLLEYVSMVTVDTPLHPRCDTAPTQQFGAETETPGQDLELGGLSSRSSSLLADVSEDP